MKVKTSNVISKEAQPHIPSDREIQAALLREQAGMNFSPELLRAMAAEGRLPREMMPRLEIASEE